MSNRTENSTNRDTLCQSEKETEKNQEAGQGSKFGKKGYLVKTGWVTLQKQTIPKSSSLTQSLTSCSCCTAARTGRDAKRNHSTAVGPKTTVWPPTLNLASPGAREKTTRTKAWPGTLETPSWRQALHRIGQVTGPHPREGAGGRKHACPAPGRRGKGGNRCQQP